MVWGRTCARDKNRKEYSKGSQEQLVSRARQAGLQGNPLLCHSVMLWGYFDCCCCAWLFWTCCKEIYYFCFAPHLEGQLQEGLAWVDLVWSPEILRCWPDLPSSERMSLDQIWEPDGSCCLGAWPCSGMLQHSGPRDGKLFTCTGSLLGWCVPVQAGGRCMAFIMKLWKLVISVIALLVKAVTTPGVGELDSALDWKGLPWRLSW